MLAAQWIQWMSASVLYLIMSKGMLELTPQSGIVFPVNTIRMAVFDEIEHTRDVDGCSSEGGVL